MLSSARWRGRVTRRGSDRRTPATKTAAHRRGIHWIKPGRDSSPLTARVNVAPRHFFASVKRRVPWHTGIADYASSLPRRLRPHFSAIIVRNSEILSQS